MLSVIETKYWDMWEAGCRRPVVYCLIGNLTLFVTYETIKLNHAQGEKSTVRYNSIATIM